MHSPVSLTQTNNQWFADVHNHLPNACPAKIKFEGKHSAFGFKPCNYLLSNQKILTNFSILNIVTFVFNCD